MPDRKRNPQHEREPMLTTDGTPTLPDDSEEFVQAYLAGLVLGNSTDGAPSEVIDISPPGTPTGLSVVTGANLHRVYLDVAWAAPSAGAAPAQYEVAVTKTGGEPMLVRVAGTSVRVEPVEPNTEYSVEVRAISRVEVAGEWTSPSTGFSAVDATTPATPGAPTLTAGIRTILVRWAAVADIDNGVGSYEVQIATDAGFTSNVRTAKVSGTITSFSDLSPNTQYFVRVRAYTPAGTAGSYGTSASVTTGLIGAGDIEADSITAGQIAADSIGTAELAADAVTAAKLSAIILEASKYIRSTSYTPGSSGWNIDADGTAEFNEVTARGILAGGGHDAAVNYIGNGNFEVNSTAGWAATNFTLANVTTAPRGGSRHLRAHSPSPTSLIEYSMTLGPPGFYVALLWVRAASGSTTVTTSVSGGSGSAGGSWTVGTTYVPVYARFLVTTAGASVTLRLTCPNEFYVDDAVCERVSVLYAGRVAPVAVTGDTGMTNDLGARGPRILQPGDGGTPLNFRGGLYVVKNPTTFPGGMLGDGAIAEMLHDGSIETVRVGVSAKKVYLGNQEISVTDDSSELYLGREHSKVTTTEGTDWATHPTSATAALEASTSNPLLGTGATNQLYYTRFGNLIHAWGVFRFGSSGTNAGSGVYQVALPVAPNTSVHLSRSVLGTWLARDDSSNTQVSGQVFFNTGSFVRFNQAAGGQVTQGVPWAWAASDELYFQVTYICA